MGNCISHSSVASLAQIQGNAHANTQQRSTTPQLPQELLRSIAAVASENPVLVMQQVPNNEMRAAVHSLNQTDLNLINQLVHLNFDFYASENGPGSVTRDLAQRRVIARDLNTSPALQLFLANSNDARVREALADNPNLLPETQQTLAQDQDAWVRWALAGNPNLLPELQQTLAQDPDVGVRWHLEAGNRNLLPALQLFLASSNHVGVLMALADNPNLLPETQQTLAQDQDAWVRWALAGNPNLLPELQQTLAQDPDVGVRWHLAAGNRNLLPELQQTLAQDQDALVRNDLAFNRNLLPEIQQTLAQDQDAWVRRDLAANPNLLPEIQQTLAQDQDAWVRRALAGNPSVTLEAERIMDEAENDGRPLEEPDAQSDVKQLTEEAQNADTPINQTLNELGITDEHLDNFASEELVENDLICPMSHCLMRDPVSTKTGITYERAFILCWLKSNNTDPITRDQLNDKTLEPNNTKKNQIVKFLKENEAAIKKLT